MWLTTETAGWRGLADKKPQGQWKDKEYDDMRWRDLDPENVSEINDLLERYEIKLPGKARGEKAYEFYVRKTIHIDEFEHP